MDVCPPFTVPCPIDAARPSLGFTCISPLSDPDNCGGCAALGQGVRCAGTDGDEDSEMEEGEVEGVKQITTCTNGYCGFLSYKQANVLGSLRESCSKGSRSTTHLGL
ncbi:hypothetical protein AMATHDRAFT_61627 [Amanita thiersii Skay4041]|uniref:Uncharacterized protein n=1 Tax=Amanita thiersii Skay4041 TaxID=703135 RepID=A0A2A9NLE6_9AGAR|nr:hypothetical protein AMATHDRAFT_61627 [Amanita thiersii Skay4041]